MGSRIKDIILVVLFLFVSIQTFAQVTSVNENFNTTCSAGHVFPSPTQWTHELHNAAAGDSLGWQCTVNGRGSTPGMSCSGFYANVNHVDTALLIVPPLNVSGYSGNVYLQFDTKTTNFYFGAKLQLLESQTDSTLTNGALYSNITSALMPAFSIADSTDWVTHQVDITAYKSFPVTYFAFRYVDSIISVGSIWYLDNVTTTVFPLNVQKVNKTVLPLAVIGNGTSDAIKLSCNTANGGNYELAVYDMLGREATRRTINITSGNSFFTVRDLNLQPGMYIIKMGNNDVYGYAKTIVE